MRLLILTLALLTPMLYALRPRATRVTWGAGRGLPTIHRKHTTARSQSALLLSSNTQEEKRDLAQSIVTGLTNALVFGTGAKDGGPIEYKQPSVTPAEVAAGIQKDFEDGYLFSGKIQTDIYNSQCTFRDPTLEFKGLSTFQKNIKSVEPALNLFLGDWLCILYTIRQDEASRQVTTEWRMVGDILLPWKPRLDLKGSTRFSYLKSDLQDVTPGASSQAKSSTTDTEVYRNDGRIISYYETWQIGALDALKQLIRGSEDSRGIEEIGRAELTKAINVYAFDKESNSGKNL